MLHPEQERKAFGARLARARAAAGFTLLSAAKALAERGFVITDKAIGAWETGRNVPDALALRWLARLYQVPVDVLYADATIELETIHLAARLKDVVLGRSDMRASPPDSERLTSPERPVKTDELFNLKDRETGDARNQPRGPKKQGSRASTPPARRPSRKG